jgi:hypothetical protein
MKYIKVTNKTGNVNRLRLEKLGFSSKREVEETIGQFGSGIKFAPIAAIRKGMEFVFSGNDDKGAYNLSYIIKDDEGIPSVYYKYDDYEKPSSFTADAGLLSWESNFQIYREIVANAIDESKITGEPWSIQIVHVDKIEPVEGEFSVYITATDEMIDINNNFDKYFSVNRTPVWSYGSSAAVYMPIDNKFRVYCKGVLVYSSEDLNEKGQPASGIFDYEFNTLTLNEERTIKNFFEVKYNISNLIFANVDDKAICKYIIESLIDVEIDGLQDDYFETSEITEYIYENSLPNTMIKEVFEILFPKTIVEISTSCSVNFIASVKARGYKVLRIETNPFFAFLKRSKVPTYDQLFGDYFFHKVEMGIDGYPFLEMAFEMVKNVIPEIQEIENIIGVYFDDENKNTLAVTSSIKLNEDDEIPKKILFNRDHAENSSIKKLIGTLVHEWDHYRSDISDGNDMGRRFRDLADDTISELIYRIYKMQKEKV